MIMYANQSWPHLLILGWFTTSHRVKKGPPSRACCRISFSPYLKPHRLRTMRTRKTINDRRRSCEIGWPTATVKEVVSHVSASDPRPSIRRHLRRHRYRPLARSHQPAHRRRCHRRHHHHLRRQNVDADDFPTFPKRMPVSKIYPINYLFRSNDERKTEKQGNIF